MGWNPTGYTDNTCLNPAIDRRTGSMDLKYREFQRKRHLYRNCFNTNLPSNPAEALELKWVPQPDARNRYHRYDVYAPGDRRGNVKWLSRDGKREVIFRDNGQPDNSHQNVGTYNYDGLNDFNHFFQDVLPYYYYGNGPVSPSDCQCQSLGEF